jgi:FMN phosphatase YigB (HAD superfamily)
MTENNYSIFETKFSDNAIISFDFLDTLVEKPFFQQEDLFELMSNDVEKIVGDKNFNFKKLRMLAEKFAYKNKKSSETIDLNDIYAEIKKLTDLSQAHIMEIEKLEVCYEQKFFKEKAVGKQIFDIAKAMKKKIIIIADTYLPKFLIEGVLERFGYVGYTELIMCSEVGLSKRTGNIFPYLTEKFYCDPKYFLHIGDHEVEDVQIPQRYSINTMSILSTHESFTNSYYYKNIWGRDETAIATTRLINSVLASKFHFNRSPSSLNTDKSAFNNDAYRVGYFGLGPVLLSFVQWILQKSQDDYVKHLYFLSSNGLFLKSAYDILAKHYYQAPVSYDLLCSKKVNNFSELVRPYDLYALLDEPFSSITVEDYFYKKFGINITQEILERHGLHVGAIIDKTHHEKQVFAIFDELHGHIVEQAQNEKNYYSAYLKYQYLPNPDKSAIVDIGYDNDIQANLSEIAKQKIGGYYLMTFIDTIEKVKKNNMPISGYLGNFEEKPQSNHAWQLLFESIEQSFSTFELNENTINPIFVNESHNEATESFITEVQSAALEFVADFERIFNKHIPQFYFSPKQVAKPLCFFFEQKSESSRLLKNVSSDKIVKHKPEVQSQNEYKDESESEDTGLMKSIGRVLKEIKKAL